MIEENSNLSPFAPERYLNYNRVLKNYFPERIQKISINAGFTCPNRDGNKGTGGCTYCNNQTFIPEYCHPSKSVLQQIEEGIEFFRKKYPNQVYFAYFQSYTNTYAPIGELISLYEQALQHPQVKGIVVGTRPDCVSDQLLDYFAELSGKVYVMIEYGIESTNDTTLERINRGHDFACGVRAVHRTALRGIKTAVHLIIGLQGENRDMILNHADKLSELPINALKLHQLQIVKGTLMGQQYVENPQLFHLFTADEYIDLVIDFIERLSPTIGIERFVSQSPNGFVIAPDWGLKNFEFIAKLEKRLIERNTWQGRRKMSHLVSI